MGTYKNQALENEQLFQKLLANYVSKIKNKSEIMDYYHITGICYLTLAYFSHGTIFNSLKQLKILANNKYYSKALKNKNFNKIIGKKYFVLRLLLVKRQYFVALVLSKVLNQ